MEGVDGGDGCNKGSQCVRAAGDKKHQWPQGAHGLYNDAHGSDLWKIFELIHPPGKNHLRRVRNSRSRAAKGVEGKQRRNLDRLDQQKVRRVQRWSDDGVLAAIVFVQT